MNRTPTASPPPQLAPSPAHEIPWIQTPCMFSPQISRKAGCKIFLKLENLQPSGSFKTRSIGNMMVRAAAANGNKSLHFYCSSGGNAGLACAISATALNCPATIVVPETTSNFMVAKLSVSGAEVVRVGASWAEADRHLREKLLHRQEEPAVMGKTKTVGIHVPPFDHPDIWAGNATMMDEVVDQVDGPVHAVVCSVGGGGLLNGLMEGTERMGLARESNAPRVLAVETIGAHSLYESVCAGELVTLDRITSIATSLGARRVSDKTWEWATKAKDRLISATVTDAEAVKACADLLDDARVLVEPACGAAIVPAYTGMLRKRLGVGLTDEEWAEKSIVLVVCGGSNISLKILNDYREKYGLSAE